MFLEIFGGLFGLVLPLLLIAGVVYVVVRSKGNHHDGVTIYDALAAYFYAIVGASVITTVVGVILFIDVALKESTSGEADQIALASVLVGTGFVVGLLHVLGIALTKRRGNKMFAGVRRAYLFSMLGIFSLAGLVSLPLAIHSVVKHYVVEHSRYYDGFPSTEAAVALVVVPVWCYYIYRVIRETARKKDGGEVSTGEGVAPPGD